MESQSFVAKQTHPSTSAALLGIRHSAPSAMAPTPKQGRFGHCSIPTLELMPKNGWEKKKMKIFPWNGVCCEGSIFCDTLYLVLAQMGDKYFMKIEV